MADNHTLRDLVEYSQRFLDLPAEVAEGLRQKDGIQEICAVDSYAIRLPEWAEMEQFRRWLEQLEAILRGQLPG